MITPNDPWQEKSTTTDKSVEETNTGFSQTSINKDPEEDDCMEDETDFEDEESPESSAGDRKRSRTARTYPASSFSDALEIGAAVYEHAGDRIRRLTLMEKMGRSPTSGATRQMFTNSGKYGITKGSYTADYLVPILLTISN